MVFYPKHINLPNKEFFAILSIFFSLKITPPHLSSHQSAHTNLHRSVEVVFPPRRRSRLRLQLRLLRHSTFDDFYNDVYRSKLLNAAYGASHAAGSGEDDIVSMSSNFGSKMVEPSVISNARFTYVHDYHKFLPLQAVDTHHIVAQRSVVKPIVIYLFVILLIAYATFLHFEQGKPVTTVLWCLLFGLLLVKLFIWRPIVKESVIIMPAFGVQLETHYGSGKIRRCFIPVSKILKPVLNEHVTPVTCWWCLSLLLRDQDELTLVFKKFHPPLKMLVPIWKALCDATECKQSSEVFQEEE